LALVAARFFALGLRLVSFLWTVRCQQQLILFCWSAAYLIDVYDCRPAM